jgi:hypothetical protein
LYIDVPFLLPELLITMLATNNKEASGVSPAPRRVQDSALNLTWFRGGGDVTLFIGFLLEKIGKRFLK